MINSDIIIESYIPTYFLIGMHVGTHTIFGAIEPIKAGRQNDVLEQWSYLCEETIRDESKCTANTPQAEGSRVDSNSKRVIGGK